MVTDGQLHLRQVLHPKSLSRNFTVPDYYNSFYDIRKEFKSFYHTEDMASIPDMLRCILLFLYSDRTPRFVSVRLRRRIGYLSLLLSWSLLLLLFEVNVLYVNCCWCLVLGVTWCDGCNIVWAAVCCEEGSLGVFEVELCPAMYRIL